LKDEIPFLVLIESETLQRLAAILFWLNWQHLQNLMLGFVQSWDNELE
jgi:hypothetical protein